jgi:hypothetical protein
MWVVTTASYTLYLMRVAKVQEGPHLHGVEGSTIGGPDRGKHQAQI